mmetsp:Transcript_46640/g.101348  ORF Transcript_46640/g.101348 Transcript_46640/m.101348 type:complete len:104 (+) Transcript_46640:76-387(+)|eukprot:CAMPEP_0204253980 /NCGR_PEP_ID=MMETSP0468-20130131/2261_1 /ASSEMBLY_ACC=CAM_ASM_000383 /TAXON_ID=2969 /ORGANISM="Oxyrrhis marina" /LENGTH=103 /DNA_ID=CAMNT_0051227661 /DNA_START=33 /DNA_END=344 /DNA_ORIENTATION=-
MAAEEDAIRGITAQFVERFQGKDMAVVADVLTVHHTWYGSVDRVGSATSTGAVNQANPVSRSSEDVQYHSPKSPRDEAGDTLTEQFLSQFGSRAPVNGNGSTS